MSEEQADEQGDEGLTDFSDVGGLDPAVDRLIAAGEQRRQEARLPLAERRQLAREREKSRDRRGRRAVYDLDPELIEAVKAIAAEHGVPASQVAAVLLTVGLEALAAGEVDLEALKTPSDSPRFEWNLDLERLEP